jgi:hypothetical protein
MLQVNGLDVNWQPEAALDQILDIAEGRRTVTDFARWLPTVPGTAAPEQNAEADMQAITRIMHDHRWLLHELEQR